MNYIDMKHLLFSSFLLIALSAQGQNAWNRAMHGISYNAEAQVTVSDGDSPLWLTSNKYGLSSTDGSHGYIRAGVFRPVEQDSAYKWRIGFGVDLAAGYNLNSTFRVQQLYADFDYKLVRLSVGAKQELLNLKNTELSSGGQTFGINATPIPQVRFSLPEYWSITGKSNWAAIKGYIGYGFLTDGRFQEDYLIEGEHYARHALYHAKAGFLRIGNEDRFPLTLEGGLEMACMFGGTIYNAGTYDGIATEPLHMGTSIGDFVDATFGTGGDETDGDGYANATGNTVGSWLFRLNYKGKGWRASVYYDHFFEDHSQMFFEYGWKDGLYGVELELPKNPVVGTVVYEFIYTKYQSGPVYHDHTDAIPDQISGRDKYYNHNLYVGWQHWGQAIGNPLFISPLYRNDGTLDFQATRFKAHHFGLSGDPTDALHYRVLYTHERNFGTYESPYESVRATHSFLAEVGISPKHIGKLHTEGWKLGAAVAFDHGTLLGNNTGFQITIAKSGILIK